MATVHARALKWLIRMAIPITTTSPTKPIITADSMASTAYSTPSFLMARGIIVSRVANVALTKFNNYLGDQFCDWDHRDQPS